MPEARPGTYAVEKNSEIAPKIAKTLAQDLNMRGVRLIDFRGDANANRPPDYFLYIYNTTPRNFEIRRPPNFPLIRFSGCPRTDAEAEIMHCHESELIRRNGRIVARKVARVQNVVNEKWIDSASGDTRVNGINGERFAMDLVNPSNLGIDMWAEIADPWLDGGGTDDMSRRGLFWTANDPPSDDELIRSRQRLETHYQSMLRHADELERDPLRRKEIGKEHHLAADYFDYDAPWHKIASVKVSCENCGEPLPRENVPFHRNSMGLICIRDWEGAVNAGVKTKAEVPEEKRWWKEKSA